MPTLPIAAIEPERHSRLPAFLGNDYSDWRKFAGFAERIDELAESTFWRAAEKEFAWEKPYRCG